jgi:hypothetical protein
MSSWEVIEPGEYKYPFALKVKIKKIKKIKGKRAFKLTWRLVSKCQFSAFL